MNQPAIVFTYSCYHEKVTTSERDFLLQVEIRPIATEADSDRNRRADIIGSGLIPARVGLPGRGGVPTNRFLRRQGRR